MYNPKDVPVVPAAIAPEKNNKSKVCGDCGKSFNTNYKLKEHQKTHSSDTPYHCTVQNCMKKFRSKIGLAQHEAAHSGKFSSIQITTLSEWMHSSLLQEISSFPATSAAKDSRLRATLPFTWKRTVPISRTNVRFVAWVSRPNKVWSTMKIVIWAWDHSSAVCARNGSSRKARAKHINKHISSRRSESISATFAWNRSPANRCYRRIWKSIWTTRNLSATYVFYYGRENSIVFFFWI